VLGCLAHGVGLSPPSLWLGTCRIVVCVVVESSFLVKSFPGQGLLVGARDEAAS
jgi:hypothetical protein